MPVDASLVGLEVFVVAALKVSTVLLLSSFISSSFSRCCMFFVRLPFLLTIMTTETIAKLMIINQCILEQFCNYTYVEKVVMMTVTTTITMIKMMLVFVLSS